MGIESGPLVTSDSKSNTILSRLNWHVLLRRSLNLCSCITWFLLLSVRINRAWCYKEPKVSVLQANANLVQKGECWTWNQRLWEAKGSVPTGVTFLLHFFLFSRGNTSAANIGIIAILVHFEKTRLNIPVLLWSPGLCLRMLTYLLQGSHRQYVYVSKYTHLKQLWTVVLKQWT